jgi:CRP-like cAMP-binding protein
MIEPIRREEYLKELKFFHSITVFSEFSRNAIERLKLNLNEKKYLKGEIVIEQKDPINYIFIVKSGSFQVTYKTTKNIVNEFDLNYYSNITPLGFRFTENRKHEIKGFKKTEENLKLFSVEKGHFIGDLEFIHKRNLSYFTITCVQKDSILISIPKNVFKLISFMN